LRATIIHNSRAAGAEGLYAYNPRLGKDLLRALRVARRLFNDEGVGAGSYLTQLALGRLVSLEDVSVHRGGQLQLLWGGSPLHFDEAVLPDSEAPGPAAPGTLEVRLEAGALTLWLPGRPDEN